MLLYLNPSVSMFTLLGGRNMTKKKATRYNSGKLKWSLVSFQALKVLVNVLMFGADKYGPDNWKRGLVRSELLESMQRHLAALIDGEEFDCESELPHVGHIMANAMFYSYHYYHFSFIDESVLGSKERRRNVP